MKTSESKIKENEMPLITRHSDLYVTKLWMSMKGEPYYKYMENESDAKNWLLMEFCEFLDSRETYLESDSNLLVLKNLMIDELLDVVNFCYFYSAEWVLNILIKHSPLGNDFIREILTCWVVEVRMYEIRAWEGKQAKKGRLNCAVIHSLAKIAEELRTSSNIKSEYTRTKLFFASLTLEKRQVYDHVLPQELRSDGSMFTTREEDLQAERKRNQDPLLDEFNDNDELWSYRTSSNSPSPKINF